MKYLFFLRTLVFGIVLLSLTLSASAQPRWSELDTHALLNAHWSPEEIAKANTAKDSSYLTPAEKDVILYINLARLDGPKFADTFVKDAIKNWWGTIIKSYQNSLISDLKKVKNLRMLVPDKRLYEAAKYHAKDMGKTGIFGHDSSDGTSCGDRIGRYWGTKYGCSECCDRCFDTGLEITLHLLFDEKVPSLGHRKALIDPTYEYLGVSIQPHIRWEWTCVVDFGFTVPEDLRSSSHSSSSSSSSSHSRSSVSSHEASHGPQSVVSPLTPRAHTNTIIYLLIVIAIQFILACFKAKPYVHATVVALLLAFFYFYDVPDFVKLWRENVEHVVDDGK